MNLGLLAGAAFGALVSLRIIPTKAKKSLPAAIVFAITAVLVVVTLVTAIINSGIFAPNTENDGHKRSDPYEIYDGTADRTYHPCLEEGNEIWFEYKASSSEERRFYLGSIESEYTISIYKGKSKDAISTATNDELVVEVESGKTYLILVTLSTDSYVDSNWSISVGDPVPAGASASKASPLTVGDTGVKEYSFLSSYEYSDVWFKFTPTESGKYIFEVYESSSTPNIYIYTDPDGSYLESNWNGKMEYVLTAGTTYYYKVSASGSYYGYSFGVKLNPEPKGTSDGSAYVLTEDGFSYTEYESLENGTDVWFKFVPTASSYYKFIPDEGNLYYYVYSKSSYGYLSSMSASSGYYSMDAGSEYYVKVYSVYNDDGFDMQVEHVLGTSFDDAIELSDTDSTEAASTAYIHTYAIYFKFTPDVSGYYSFDTDYYYSHDLYLYSENDTSTYLTSAYNAELKYYLEADTTYYLKLSYSYNYCDDSFTVSVDSIEAGSDRLAAYDIFEGKNEAQEYASLVDGTEVWFKFTPEDTGYYQFALTGASTDYSCYVYDGFNTYYESSYGIYYYLSSGSTYYIYYYDVTDDDSFGIKVEQAKGDSMYNAIELENNVICNTGYYSAVHSNSTMYFEFTPDTSCSYKFSVEGMDYSYFLYLCNYDTHSCLENSNNDYLTYALDAGVKYYIYISMSSYDDSFSMLVSTVYQGSTKEVSYGLELGENESKSYASFTNSNSVWFNFTPQETGYYDFIVNTGIQVYALGDDAQSYTISVASTAGDTVTYTDGYGYYMTYGYTYYLLFTADDTYETNDFGVTVSKAITGTSKDDAYELTLDEVLETGWLYGVNQSYTMWFKFTPDSTGYYNLYFSNADARYIDIYEGSNTSYSYYSNSASSSYSCMTVYMSEGYTYYIKVDFSYYYYYDYDFDMLISNTARGSSSSDAVKLGTDFTLAAGYDSYYNYGGEVWFKFVPDTTGYYQFCVGDAYTRYVYIYDGAIDTVYNCGYTSSSSNYATVKLTAGGTYYVCVDFYSSYDSSFYVSVQKMYYGVTAEDAISIGASSIYTGYNSSYNTDNEIWYTFTTSDAGEYVLYLYNISEYCNVYVYSDIEANNLVANDTGFSGSEWLYFDCEADTTYYVKVYFTNYWTDSSFYISAYKN